MSKSQKEEGVNSFNGNWDDLTCFQWEMRNGISIENEAFVNLYKGTAKTINELIPFEKFTDLGGGVGAYSKAMRDIGKEVHYYDANTHHHEYAFARKVANRYYYGDFSKMTIEGDLLAMIEVAEHIEDEKLIPFLTNVKCNYFHFSSTPHVNKMDKDWGHINIKQEQEWIDLFTSCGFKFMQKVQLPTYWSLLFTK
jgi:2-polyprenyl-3-methyl-5-hydroxy-6-metoxy-1,4-benzoquinol methylase